jgi:hypothetical protein
MGFFNLIETFFFLSLGITFVLILLLVYHFKQRLSSLENRCDTVFEIMSNVVQELNNIKKMQQYNYATNGPTNMIDLNTIIPLQSDVVTNKIKVSDEDFDEDDDSDHSETSSDCDTQSESDDDSVPSLIDDDNYVIDQERESDIPSTIKIINIDIGESIETDIIEQDLEQEPENDIDENDNLEAVELNEEEKLHVEKLDEISVLEKNDLTVSTDEIKETSKDVYSKMSVSELKALVITKGLSSDPSKKKKHELLKMLEASDN